MPHPLALFSLQPLNERAEAVVNHPSDRHLVPLLQDKEVLDIGHVRSKTGHETLAALGRDGDIVSCRLRHMTT